MHPVTRTVARMATNVGLVADAWSDWSILDSKRFSRLHTRLVESLPKRDAMPLCEIDARHASRDAIVEFSNDFTRPMVVRGALRGMPCLTQWSDRAWWLQHYAEAEVLCTSANESRMLPVRQAFADDKDFYIAGAASIFQEHPELAEAVDTDLTRSLAPHPARDKPVFYQLFMGRSKQGTTLHGAASLNLFRQISGRKRWYFLRPDQTPYVRAKIFATGFAATSLTIQPHGDEPGSPWFERLERFTTVLEPGDLLINPPWWWHCVENLPGDDLIAGVATRYFAGPRVLRIDPLKTALAYSRILAGGSGVKIGENQDPVAYERSLIANRLVSNQQFVLKT